MVDLSNWEVKKRNHEDSKKLNISKQIELCVLFWMQYISIDQIPSRVSECIKKEFVIFTICSVAYFIELQLFSPWDEEVRRLAAQTTVPLLRK